MNARQSLGRAAAASLLAAMCALAVGCTNMQSSLPPPPVPEPESIRYGRVGIVEFFDRSGHPGTAEKFSAELRRKLAERSTDTDVVVIKRTVFPSLNDPFVVGSIPVDVLVKGRRDYLVDALVFGSVDTHSPYVPLSVHVSMKIVDTATAEVPYEISKGWDGSHRVVRDAVGLYYRTHVGSDDCKFGPDAFLVSPTYFLRFVAAEVADEVVAAL